MLAILVSLPLFDGFTVQGNLNENKNNTIIVSLITIILISVAFMHKGMNMKG